MRLLVLALAAVAAIAPAKAGIVARIDNASQRMTVIVDGVPAYSWPVSTARPGYRTPAGMYRVQRMERTWYSRKYDNAPMPHALFFRGGYAIHGTTSIAQLGRPASHGCVRLSPGHARQLFQMVQQAGGARIVVTNEAGPGFATVASRRRVGRRPDAPVLIGPPDAWPYEQPRRSPYDEDDMIGPFDN
ncbi:L,D-transpeptidase [Methylobacterium nigriterrae]|uniref:L,D-transpeptidase n=1 Tax=Methylobacterium nigriterrae TaxID=3127512 RepID=UPI003013D908